MSSETPRTDALTARMASELDKPILSADHMAEMCDHARQLERELAQEKKDAKKWRKHQEVMAQGRLPHALYMRFTAVRNGEVWNNEAVLDVQKLGERTHLGIEAVGLAAKHKVTELFAAIDAALQAQRETG